VRECLVCQQLPGALRDAGRLYFVSAELVGFARRDVADEIVAIAQDESVAEVRIGLDDESKLGEQLARNSHEPEVPEGDNRHVRQQLSAGAIDSLVALVRIIKGTQRGQFV